MEREEENGDPAVTVFGGVRYSGPNQRVLMPWPIACV